MVLALAFASSMPAFAACRDAYEQGSKASLEQSEARLLETAAGGIMGGFAGTMLGSAATGGGVLIGMAALAVPLGAFAIRDEVRHRDWQRGLDLLSEAHAGSGLELDAEFAKVRRHGGPSDFSKFVSAVRWADEHEVFCPNANHLYRMKEIEIWLERKSNQDLAEARAPATDGDRQAPRVVADHGPLCSPSFDCGGHQGDPSLGRPKHVQRAQ